VAEHGGRLYAESRPGEGTFLHRLVRFSPSMPGGGEVEGVEGGGLAGLILSRPLKGLATTTKTLRKINKNNEEICFSHRFHSRNVYFI